MTNLDRRLAAAELVDQPYPKVYCPLPWCAAHARVDLPCGDAEGEYSGMTHQGRIDYVATAARQVRRTIARLKADGIAEPEQLAGLLYGFQRSCDMGFVPGRKGRRRLI